MQFRDFTKNEIDAAYQLKLMGFKWTWDMGDFFSHDLRNVSLAMEKVEEGNDVYVVNKQGEKVPLRKAVWLPKWSQCVQWFIEHGLPKIVVDTKPDYSKVEVSSEQTPPITGIGVTDLEAAYEAMLEVLERERTGLL